MKKAIQHQWAEALRSDQYVQGTGYLRDGDNKQSNHCVMGVLAELAVDAGVVAEDAFSFAFGTAVPQEVLDWAGITNVDQNIFIDLNDDEYYTFGSFADFLDGLDEDADLTESLYAAYNKASGNPHPNSDDYEDDEEDDWDFDDEEDELDEPVGIL